MKTFDEQIREVQAERQRAEFWETQKRIARGENIYAWYCAWCNGYNDGTARRTARPLTDTAKNKAWRLIFGGARRLAKTTLAKAMSGMEKNGWWRNE